MFAMFAKCFAARHGGQIRPSESDNAGSGSTLACQLIPIVPCFRQTQRGNTERGAKGRACSDGPDTHQAAAGRP